MADTNVSIVRQYLNQYEEDWKSEEHIKDHVPIVLSTITGSRLYNTHQSDKSDVDVVAVYMCHAHYLLGLEEIKKVHCLHAVTNNKSIPRKERLQSVSLDYVTYEIGKFCNMLVSGNPIAIEILAVVDKKPELVGVKENNWNEIIEKLFKTDALITRELIDNYIGYARSQQQMATKLSQSSGIYDERAAKAMYHAIRVTLEAIHVASTGSGPRIIHDCNDIQLMKNIKLRILSLEDAQQTFNCLTQRMHFIITSASSIYSQLPNTANNEVKDFVHQWLVTMRMKFIHQNEI